MKVKLMFLLLLAIISPCVFSVPLENLVTASQAAALRSSGELIMEIQLKNPSPKMLPLNNELRQSVNSVVNSLKPNTLVEALYLYKKPEKFITSADSWDLSSKIRVLNQTLALSSLTGTQYYSASRSTLRTFYEFSGVIDGPNTKKPLPDPVYNHFPESITLYAQQIDLSFGDNIYRYLYQISDDIIFFAQENMTPMNYGIITAIKKNNLRSILAVIDCGDSILIYAVSMTKTISLPGMADRISSSFSSRAEAVLKWFTGRLDSEIFAR